MSARPVVSVFDPESAKAVGTVTLPAVFSAPIRSDVVHYVHTLMAKNARQPYAVAPRAGMETPAQSWGTGRAVSRIPRVPGGGTSRSGQGAFGNMCRGGRMFAPTKIWRRWHRKISVGQRRFAVSSAIAASGVTPLVMARGHKIDEVPEVPLVLADSLNAVSKTKEVKAILQRVGAMQDVLKSADSKKLRCGAGKSRNRRYVQRRGPLVIYDVSEGLDRGFRNLSGVDTTSIDNLSLLDLAPGGHVGRFCIWTKGAFEKLDSLFGTYEESSQLKSGFALPRSIMTNTDLARIINSDEIQSVVKDPTNVSAVLPQKRNPLRVPAARVALNPYHAEVKKRESTPKTAAAVKKAVADQKARSKKFRKARIAFWNGAKKEGDVSF
jgi:large subunit ribosomal protein L4e